jgi:hypothetical protein
VEKLLLLFGRNARGKMPFGWKNRVFHILFYARENIAKNFDL